MIFSKKIETKSHPIDEYNNHFNTALLTLTKIYTQ